jgi:hypothetical protein
MKTQDNAGKYLLIVVVAVIALWLLTGCGEMQASVGYTTPNPTTTPQPSPVPSNQGLNCEVYAIPASTYAGVVNWSALFSAGTPKFSIIQSNLDVQDQLYTNLFGSFTAQQQALVGNTNFALDCEGFLNVPETNGYVLQLSSDDGSQLIIDDIVVINMPQAQVFSTKTSGTMTLFAGLHKINVLYFQGPATYEGLILQWQGPANQGLGTMGVIPAAALSH